MAETSPISLYIAECTCSLEINYLSEPMRQWLGKIEDMGGLVKEEYKRGQTKQVLIFNEVERNSTCLNVVIGVFLT